MSLANEQLHSLVTNFAHFKAFSKSHLYLVRRDGLILYSSGEKEQRETSSVGALLGGLWQAAEALSHLPPFPSLETSPLQLSFGSSSSGLFVLPLNLGEEDYFIAVIFNNMTNPAPLRNKLRLLKNHLKKFEERFIVKKRKPDFESEKYLFQNITDEEMDNLFSFPGS